MSSIIEEYNYDIFISYRQKDNKGDRWVSEFVEALKTELESTFKEEISVYFDINPHDGLLETHDVDESLKEKLKCLLFIPIISRTYCDPKSFAWEHEFKVFVKLASQDQFGLRVKLPNGNVASRVLPIRIHDLDIADIKECESVLGGVLRGIEFIYKEPGIDKPLAPEDDEKKNLNSTKYRIQIIKVAHAIKEIFLGMKAEPIQVVKEKEQTKESIKEFKADERKIEPEKPAKAGKLKLLSIVALIAVLIIVAILAYPKIFKRNTLERLRSSGEKISVAVMPFLNMTNDTIWNVWQNGIQDMLISYLSNFTGELNTKQIESINSVLKAKGITSYASLTPAVARTISQKLDASILIYGTIKEAGPKIRINAQIINIKTNESLKSIEIQGASNENSIFQIIDSLKQQVKNIIEISGFAIEKLHSIDPGYFWTNSPEVFRYSVYGNNAFWKWDFNTAKGWYLKALKIDSTLIGLDMQLVWTYASMDSVKQAKKLILKLYNKREQMAVAQQLYIDLLYATFFGTPLEGIKCYRQIQTLYEEPHDYTMIGDYYSFLYQYKEAIPEYEKALELYKKMDLKPIGVYCYADLGAAYHKTSHYKKEKKLYKKAEKDFPDNPDIIYRQAVLSLSERDTVALNKYIEKYASIQRDKPLSEAEIKSWVGNIYDEVGIKDKAEDLFRQALKLKPDDPDMLNSLARLLIDNDRNINEGMKLIDRALALNPNNHYYMHTKGWGLYKQGKHKEALEILEKSWDLKAWWDQELFLHLEAAKKAVAGLKNN